MGLKNHKFRRDVYFFRADCSKILVDEESSRERRGSKKVINEKMKEDSGEAGNREELLPNLLRCMRGAMC